MTNQDQEAMLRFQFAVGLQLRIWRGEANQTIAALAINAGVNKSTVAVIETGSKSISMFAALRLTHALGHTATELFADTEFEGTSL